MESDITVRLKKQNIDPETDYGRALISLDNLYKKIDDTEKQIKYLTDVRTQTLEDIELLELLIMHKFNKDMRKSKWE